MTQAAMKISLQKKTEVKQVLVRPEENLRTYAVVVVSRLISWSWRNVFSRVTRPAFHKAFVHSLT
jgi:hypothetical protein